MNKTIATFIIAATISVPTFAQISEKSDISDSVRGRLVLEHRQEKDSLAAMDQILLIKDDDTKIIFHSEGRRIEEVLEEDLDGDNIPEILIKMDLGGSGAFKEFALVKNTDDNYQVIWEETGFAAGNATIEDRDQSGSKKLYIDYTDTEVEPAKEATVVYRFNNGEFEIIPK